MIGDAHLRPGGLKLRSEAPVGGMGECHGALGKGYALPPLVSTCSLRRGHPHVNDSEVRA